MSKIMTKLKSIWSKMAEKEYRDAYVEAKLDSELAAQIFAIRNQRNWTQEDLAQQAGMAQPRIARLESSCHGVSVNTLKRLASAFDVALTIKFVPFSEVATSAAKDIIDRPIPQYSNDATPHLGYVFHDQIRGPLSYKSFQDRSSVASWKMKSVTPSSDNFNSGKFYASTH